MIRLAEARAKLELREAVTADDARDTVEMMRESLFEAVTDELGTVDFSRASGMSKGKQAKLLVAALSKAADNRGHAKFTTEEIDRCARDLRIDGASVADLIDVLNQQSYLLKTGPREWRLATSAASAR
jgi:DNA helicase MCM8